MNQTETRPLLRLFCLMEGVSLFSAFTALIAKLASRPSMLLGMAWMLFALVVVLLFGPAAFRSIAADVRAGFKDQTLAAKTTPPPVVQPESVGAQALSWLPTICCWVLLATWAATHWIAK